MLDCGYSFPGVDREFAAERKCEICLSFDNFFEEEAEIGDMDSPQVGSPSAGGSPAAVAATSGVEGVDGMEVARRMVQAAEAAAQAAQAATRAVEGVSRTS